MIFIYNGKGVGVKFLDLTGFLIG